MNTDQSFIPLHEIFSNDATTWPAKQFAQARLGASTSLPIILHNKLFKLSPAECVNRSNDCNCACPEDGVSLAILPTDFEKPLRTAHAHTQTLPLNHTLVFNPLHANGVSVLNEPAERIRQHFVQPRCLHDLDTGAEAIPAIRQMLAAGVLEQDGQHLQMRRRPPTTLSTWIHVTNECNLRCDYCYIRKTDDDMDEATGRAAIDAIFRSAVIHNFTHVKLKFAGGEAAMNLKRVFDIHAYAAHQAASLGITTEAVILSNGVSIGERAMAAFFQRGIQVSISLDGVGAAHDVHRKFVDGAGSFRWVDRTIGRLIARGIKPFISITLSARNAGHLSETVRYCAERDLPFNINFYRDNDCSASFDDLRYRDEQIIETLHAAFAVLEHHLPRRSLLSTLVDRAQFHQLHDKTCGVGDSYIVVDHKGNIAKCQMEIEKPVTTIFAEDPLALIRADKRSIQNLSVDGKEGCRDCEWRYWCAGGCPALTYRVTGRWDVKSPNCRIYKAVYPAMLRLEGLRLLKLYQTSFSPN